MTVSYPIIGTLNEENWALIPSEPAIFHDMMNEYGVKDVRVQDLVTFDFDNVKDEKMHGLIFISKYDDETAVQLNLKEPDHDADDIVFTAQVVTNVCGTLALLAILFNADINHKGAIIDNFLEFTKDFTPINRGMCIGNSTEMRSIHDAFGGASLEVERAYQTSAEASNENTSTNDSGMEVETEPVYHYTSFIYKNGFVWEIDGLKPRPIKIGACDPNNWVDVVEPILRKRVEVLAEKYGDEYFNLLGILDDHFPEYTTRSQILESNIKKIDKMIASKAKTKANIIRRHKNDFLEHTPQNATDYDLLRHIWDQLDKGKTDSILGDLETARTIYNSLDDKVQTYESNKAIFEKDAQRQKFDYFPFINALISVAHEKGFIEDPAEKRKREAAAAKQKKRKPRTKASPEEVIEKPTRKRKNTTQSTEITEKPTKKRKSTAQAVETEYKPTPKQRNATRLVEVEEKTAPKRRNARRSTVKEVKFVQEPEIAPPSAATEDEAIQEQNNVTQSSETEASPEEKPTRKRRNASQSTATEIKPTRKRKYTKQATSKEDESIQQTNNESQLNETKDKPTKKRKR